MQRRVAKVAQGMFSLSHLISNNKLQSQLILGNHVAIHTSVKLLEKVLTFSRSKVKVIASSILELKCSNHS